MEKFIITGGTRLTGEVEVLGVKNGILPMMAAALLAEKGTTSIANVPRLRDITVFINVLRELGVSATFDAGARLVSIDASVVTNTHAPYEWVKQMRASFLVMGPLLARFHQAKVALPGGCNIGARQVNLHIDGLRALGANITEEGGVVVASADHLKGAKYYFDMPTHTGTENVMMAACLAEGTTTLYNVACEPEVVHLANFLNAMGARVFGAGSPAITIEGVKSLRAISICAPASRIETAFFCFATAITDGEVIINNAAVDELGIVGEKLTQANVKVHRIDGNRILVKRGGKLAPVSITTWPFPGFATDVQAHAMALLTQAEGTSLIKETLFENRFMHVDEMNRLGAGIHVLGNEAVVVGVRHLHGAPVMASDIQAGAGLVIAALVAEGITTIDRIYHIDRGYENIEVRLQQLGTSIRRIRN